jgi:DNA adenine methylase
MIANKKMRSPLKWHGGKSYLARRIIALFPPHRCYVEPFAGGLSVLLNKEPADDRVADLNGRLINFWRHLRSSRQLVSLLAETDYSESSFTDATQLVAAAQNGCGAAWAFMVNNRMSRGGLGKDFAWSERLRGKSRPGGAVPGDLNAWDTIREELPSIVARLQGVRIEHQRALQTIQESAGRDTLIYCDPPYLHETRTAKKAYALEMGRDDHEQLLVSLLDSKAKVFLSGYRSALYDDALRDWVRHEFDMPNHSGQGATKQRRVECVWESPERSPGDARN